VVKLRDILTNIGRQTGYSGVALAPTIQPLNLGGTRGGLVWMQEWTIGRTANFSTEFSEHGYKVQASHFWIAIAVDFSFKLYII
jgi:hypothetical protein